MSSPTPDWGSALNAIINGVAAVVQQLGNVIASNAGLLANVLFFSGLAVAAIMVVRRLVPTLTRWFSGVIRF